ncbi:MAG: TolC family protein [Xanthomonadales bacterium]|nr:TolC family protein [Xanthomonadales bacterium]
MNITISPLWLLLACLPWPVMATDIDPPEPADLLTQSAAVAMALADDPWQRGSALRERALQAEAVVAGSLPDPRLTLGAANFPVDSLSFTQEPMTQWTVGLSQRLPRGDSRPLQQHQQRTLAGAEPHARAERRARLAWQVRQAWLAAGAAEQRAALLAHERALLTQLLSLAEVGYASGLRPVGQDDLLRAQLQLDRVDERQLALQQQAQEARAQLAEWIGPAALQLALPDQLEALSVATSGAREVDQIGRHPALLALQARIEAAATGVDLARQQYRPEWLLSAQYGHRGNAPDGRDRADFISLAVSVDLPWFTAKRQDPALAAAADRAEALRQELALLERQLRARAAAVQAASTRLEQRLALYDAQLLPRLRQLAQASQAAFQHDAGDFDPVLQAHLSELEARQTRLNLQAELARWQAEGRYLSGVDELAAEGGS